LLNTETCLTIEITWYVKQARLCTLYLNLTTPYVVVMIMAMVAALANLKWCIYSTFQ